jgi:hypothetical protein
MRKLLFSQLTREDIATLVKVHDQRIHEDIWDELAQGELSESEQRFIDTVVDGFHRVSPTLVNEATVWARSIFPLFLLAETEGVVVQADVPLSARVGDIELAGSADGAFGTPVLGELAAPFLIVVEAKRGVEGYNPVMQLYGELVAAACLNMRETGRPAQRIYGCYTVGATWTFVRADVEGLDTERPSLSVASSPELSQRLQAGTIVKILKSIVTRHQEAAA